MKKVIFVICLFLCSVVSAHATTIKITFDSLETPGTGVTHLPSYSQDGFLISWGNSPAAFGSANQDRTGWYFGSAGLFNNEMNGETDLYRPDLKAFSLKSIDLAPLSTSFGAGATVTFYAWIFGDGMLTASYTLDDTYSFQTFVLPGFDKVNYVMWEQNYPYSQFDNIVLETAPVPEPGTMALVGVGMMGLAILGKRRRNQMLER